MPPSKTTINHDPLGLFTDEPPYWVVSKGRQYERPCQTLAQANGQRIAAANKLRWHGNHNVNPAAIILAARIEACSPNRPCLSGACPICERAQQRLLVLATVSALPPQNHIFWTPPQAISLVPEFGRLARSQLANFDAVEFENKTRGALKAAGIAHCILGLDASLNHDDGKPEGACWQLQWWGFFSPPAIAWRETLKEQVNASNLVSRPVKVITPDSLEAAAAYGLKSTFTRRVSLVKANLDRPDRGECRNTNERLLRGDAWVELMLFLERIGLERRLIWNGYDIPYQPLRSRAKPAPEVVQ